MRTRPLKNWTVSLTRTNDRANGAGSASLPALVLVVLLVGGCSTSYPPDQMPPDWLIRLPSARGALYAVGICGPTYYPVDAISRASDRAREELAKSLGGRIRSMISVEQSQRGTAVSQVSVTEATVWASDVVMSSSQVVATWVDVHGLYQQGKPGTTYALAVLGNAGIAGSGNRPSGTLPLERTSELRKLAGQALETN